GRHLLPATAIRVRLNRGFESAWYTDVSYREMIKKDFLLAKLASSFVNRSSRASLRQIFPGGKDFPNFRTSRIFMQHLPYKSYASTFSYVAPKDGPQAKYGLFQSKL
uniref:uS3m-2 n=1 Tax=Polytomella magna TaxID=353565 RepID=UPI002240E4EF